MSGDEDRFAPLRRLPAESPDEWTARLREHLQAEWDAGRPVGVSEYVAALPDLPQSPELLLDLIALHRLLRAEAGESPTADEYAAQFPPLAAAIREQFALDDRLNELDTVSFHDDGPPPPTLPGRFRFRRWLGAGGYGRVCECEDTRFRRFVAVKLLNEARTAPAELERFRREAELAANQNHPSLCTLHEFYLDHRPPFLVLELIGGQNLREILDADGPLPPREVARVAREVAAALAHCHANGVIHRDLKPENVKRRADGVVKVLDFGLARPLAPAVGAWMSDERSVAGTVPYFAPEQVAGDPGPAADQFSLGVVLYELLTGRRPFVSETVDGMLLAITTETPTSPRELRPEVDERLSALVLKLLAKQPADRFVSMGAVSREFDRYLTPNAAPIPIPPPRRRWRWVAAATVLLAVGGGVAWWQLSPKPPGPGPVEMPPSHDLTGVLLRIATDLAALPAPDQEHQRYFRLGHLNATDREATHDALGTLLPKLATNGAVVPWKDVNGDGRLLRFDLRALGWRPDREWEAVVRRCPLSLRYAGPDLIPAGGTIKKLLNSDLTPFVLADWFVATASADPLLGELAGDEAGRAVRESDRLRQFREAYGRTPVDLRRGAAELGLGAPDPLRAVLLAREEMTKRLALGAWLDGGTIPRVAWDQADVDVCPAAEVATELKLGIRRLLR